MGGKQKQPRQAAIMVRPEFHRMAREYCRSRGMLMSWFVERAVTQAIESAPPAQFAPAPTQSSIAVPEAKA